MAGVANRLGLQAASFDLAAAAYSAAVGSPISGDSVRRVCAKWGEQVDAERGGRGWNRQSGQAMLAGLSELHSGRFERTWQELRPKAA